MTKISRYVIDDKVTGSDKWIGSDAQTQYTTKNFTPTKLAVYFNENQVIDIGTPIRYRYDILEVGDTRLPGTITFEPQVGTPYSLSSISSFILSKYTLKGNDVTQYLNFLIGSNVLIYKADDINIFGLYKVVSLVENIDEPDFFDVVVSYTTGNGSIVEDKDYLVSLIDGGDIPTKTSELINDGEDGVHPFITAADVTPQVNSDWNATSGVAEILNKPIIPTKTSDLTNDGEDGINPFITLADIPPSTIPNLNDVLLEGNISQLDAKIGSLYLYDTTAVDYARVDITNDIFAVTLASNNPLFQNGIGVSRVWNSIGVEGVIDYSLLTGGRIYSAPDASGTIALTSDIPAQGLTSVGLSMPAAFNVANSPLTSDGTIAVSAAGTSSQYIRGDGQLATLPSGSGGGSTVAYYLNGSINASVAGYKQLSNTATIGGGTDFTLVGNGLIAQFLTDIGNPNRLEIPGGAWNFEMFFQASSAGGSQKFYVELLKYDGTTFTSIASSVSVAEEITGGTTIDLYLTSLAVPTTPLLVTDRLAIRVYIVDNSGGRTITLHTEDNTLCEIITTFSGGVTSLNGLTANTQYLAVGTTGTDFNINSLTDTHTFNLPTASATNRGALSSTDWTAFNGKFTLPSLTSGSVLFSDGTTIAQKNSNFFWDNTNNRLGIGTNAPNSRFHLSGSITAASAIARGGNITTTLLAAANSDVLVGLDIAPTFTNGAFTTLRNIALRANNTIETSAGGMQIYGNPSTFGTLNATALQLVTAGGTSYITSFNNSVGNGFNPMILRFSTLTFASMGGNFNSQFFANGNLVINSTTDNGGKLQIKAPGALSTDIALRVRNSADSGDLMNIQGDGRINFNSALAIGSNNFYSSGENRTRFYSTAETTDNLQIYTNGGAYGSNYGEIGYLFKNTSTQMASINFDTRTSVAPFRFFVNPTGASAIDAMDIFRTGEVGIGTSNTNRGGKLQVKAPGALSTDIALRVRNSADTADILQARGNGNVGIGSGGAENKLTVYGDSATFALRVGQNTANSDGSWTGISFYNSTNTGGGSTGVGQGNIKVYRFSGGAGEMEFNIGGLSTTVMRLSRNANVLIGTTTDIASSKLTVDSTTQGFLPPRMTNAQRLAIATPAIGLMVYCTDTIEGLYINKSTGWTFII